MQGASTPRHQRPGSPLRVDVVQLLCLGVVFGVVSSLSNIHTTPVTYLLNAGWSWAALMVVAGWMVRGGPAAALAALMTGVVATVAFYLGESAWFLAGTPHLIARPGLSGHFANLMVFTVVSVVLGPGLGVVGGLVRSGGLTGLACSLVVPAGATVEMVVVPLWDPATAGTPLLLARLLVWAGSALATVLAVVRFLRERRHTAPTTRPSVGELLGPTQPARRVSVAALAALVLVGSVMVGWTLLVTGRTQAPTWQPGLSATQREATTIALVTVADSPAGSEVAVDTEMTQSKGSDPIPETVTVPRGLDVDLTPGTRYVMFLEHTDGQFRLVDGPDAVYPVSGPTGAAPANGQPLPAWVSRDLGLSAS